MVKYLKALTLIAIGLMVSSCGSSVGLDGANSYSHVYALSSDVDKARRVTKEVFAKEGFTFVGSSHSTLRFEKEGGTSAQLTWGSYGHQVMILPEVFIQKEGHRILLDCELYLSTYNGDARKPWVAGKGPYKRLLKKIKKRIEG